MAETGARFGGEHSGHYYFRDNYRADSGIIAALVVLETLARAEVAALRAAPALRALRPVRGDQPARGATRPRSSSGSPPRTPTRPRTDSTGSPSTTATGGSTCGRATPSRCCASTSRPPTPTRAAQHADRGPHARGRRGRLTAVTLDPKLLEILACPEDKGPLLVLRRTSRRCTTRACSRRYAVRDDIPIMLIDEAETVDDAEHERLRRQGLGRGHPADLRGLAPWHPTPSGSSTRRELPEQLAAAHEQAGMALDRARCPAGRRHRPHRRCWAWAAPGIAGDVLRAVGVVAAGPGRRASSRSAPRRSSGPRTLAFALSYSGRHRGDPRHDRAGRSTPAPGWSPSPPGGDLAALAGGRRRRPRPVRHRPRSCPAPRSARSSRRSS